MNLKELQEQQRAWIQHNFPNREPFVPLLGVAEELGELASVEDSPHINYLAEALGKLAHAHIKSHQGIRGTSEEHAAKAKDAAADIIIFLSDYCSAKGFDLQEVVESTWNEVKKRDWKKNKISGI